MSTTPFFAEIGSRCPAIDVAMLLACAYAPRWLMRNMHMDPEEAVQACQDLGARVLVPMQWGTFWLSREPVLEPIHRARAAWARTGRDHATSGWGRAVPFRANAA